MVINSKNHNKKENCSSLTPIIAKILLCWGSAQKIAADSGTLLPENAIAGVSKKITFWAFCTMALQSKPHHT
jgi:hypothetical protein